MKPALFALSIPGLFEDVVQSPARFVAPIQAAHNGCPLCGGHTENWECADGLYRRICVSSEHHDTGFAECAWEGEVLAESREAYYEARRVAFEARLIAEYGTTDPEQIAAKQEADYARLMAGVTGAPMLLDNLRGASLTA